MIDIFTNEDMENIYTLFTGCEVRMKKTVPKVLKTARARRARHVFKTEGTAFALVGTVFKTEGTAECENRFNLLQMCENFMREKHFIYKRLRYIDLNDTYCIHVMFKYYLL